MLDKLRESMEVRSFDRGECLVGKKRHAARSEWEEKAHRIYPVGK